MKILATMNHKLNVGGIIARQQLHAAGGIEVLLKAAV